MNLSKKQIERIEFYRVYSQHNRFFRDTVSEKVEKEAYDDKELYSTGLSVLIALASVHVALNDHHRHKERMRDDNSE